METTREAMEIQISHSGVGVILMIQHPTPWALRVLDAVEAGYGIIVRHGDDTVRVVAHVNKISSADLLRALRNEGSIDLDATRRGPQPTTRTKRTSRMTCSKCGGPTSVAGQPCGEC